MEAEQERRVMNLLPVPQRWVEAASPLSADVTSVGAVTGTGEQLHWSAIHDERVEQRALELLVDFEFGTLDIHIDQRGAPTPALGDDESYTLDYSPGASRLYAATTWGALHGLTTLWQLHALGTAAATAFHIEDHPRFGWRGLLIDVARHFMSLSLLRRVVDGMARLKMNVLHLHLTDDQAFRFASLKFPDLASAQHYSQADLLALVMYAAERGVRIVPEIDVPGHATSWLVGYPQWGVNETAATTKFGVHKGCLNPIDESVYTALDDLFEEVCDTFPDSHVHIGGDEVHPAWWNGDARIQQFIADHDLGDTRGLQAHFNRRLYAQLQARGRVAVGWDEVLHADMPPLLVQNWRGATTRDRALERSLDCVMSCGYYLDLFYPADMHYLYDPEASQSELVAFEDALRADPRLAHVADGIAWTEQWRSEAIDLDDLGVEAVQRGRVLGGEACLWSELVDEDTLEVRLWSRLPAVAERLWSAREVCDVEDFYRRMTDLCQLPGLQVTRLQADALARLGLAPAQISVATMLEPVKWYARLLGEEALQARLSGTEMPQARPYDVTSALNTIVDFISPESLPGRALAHASSDELIATCELWQSQQEDSWPADSQAAIIALNEVAGLVIDAVGMRSETELASVCAQLESLYRPFGEYMLAPIPALITWLGRSRQADKTTCR